MSIPVKIILAESSVIIRNGILSILKELDILHTEIIEITESEQLKNAFGWHTPDILMINPNLLGFYSLQHIKKENDNPSMKCIAIQSSLADSSILKIYDEVISIYDSNEQIKDKLIKLIREPKTNKRHESLSTREKEVIVCVIKGMTNKQIADKLCLSTHTVITHRRNISAKLQIHSTAGLTIYAIVNKLVDLNDMQDLASDSNIE